MDEFLKPHEQIRMIKANDAATRDRTIRLYKASPKHWEFQLRAPIELGFAGLRDGKDFIAASASLTLADLHALRNAIDAQIGGDVLTSVRALRARLLEAQGKAEAEQNAALSSRPRKRGDADRRHTISASRAGVVAAFAICISALDEILAPEKEEG